MMFITGPLYSGKRTFAQNFRGSIIADVQDAAAETQTPEQLETLARELAEYDIVIATEVGGGVVGRRRRGSFPLLPNLRSAVRWPRACARPPCGDTPIR